MTSKTVKIFTDGACSGNPGPGGWAAILQYGQHSREISGYEGRTTNQRMELTAAIEALAVLKEPCLVELHSDSAYLINAFEQKWLTNWQSNGWKNSKKKPVENCDLWIKLLEHSAKHRIKWVKVKGHSGHTENEKCDQLARKAITDSLSIEEK